LGKPKTSFVEKRMSATLEEWYNASEYIRNEGNET